MSEPGTGCPAEPSSLPQPSRFETLYLGYIRVEKEKGNIRRTVRQTNSQTDKQPDRQTARQTDKHTCILTSV